MEATALTEPNCELCRGSELLDLGGGIAAIGPVRPSQDLDVWLGPREHVTSISEVKSATRSAWLGGLQSVIRRWRGNSNADGVNVFAYVGSPRVDWPHHVALRLIGRRALEEANPVQLFNRGDVGACTRDTQRLALMEARFGGDAQRWQLTVEEQQRTCMSCAPERLDDYLIGDIGAARLFQHGGATDVGMLITCPIRHAERVEDLDHEDFDSLLAMVDAVRAMFSTVHDADGLWWSFNDGSVAGQETPHVHIHLWARSETEVTNPFANGLPPMVGRPTAHQVRRLGDAARHAFACVRDDFA
jgi:diadenosine tetraphosphate (Ap4A) HIT family hydrolase